MANYQTRLESKEKVIRCLQRNASAFTFHVTPHHNMICVYGNNSDEIVREAIEKTKHTIFGNFLVLPKSNLRSTEDDDEFTLFENSLNVFLRNTKHFGLSDYFTSLGIRRFILFNSEMKKTYNSEQKGEICKEFLVNLRREFFGNYHIGLVWNVEIDEDEFDHNPLENLSKIACENLLIIVTSKKALDYEIDLPSENIIQTD